MCLRVASENYTFVDDEAYRDNNKIVISDQTVGADK